MSSRLEGANNFHAEMQAYLKANADVSRSTEAEAVAKQGFTFESDHSVSERLITGVKPTTVYEAPKPRRRRVK